MIELATIIFSHNIIQTQSRLTNDRFSNSLGRAMHLLDVEPDHLAPFADMLLTMTGGKIGNLRGILALAMASAITDRDDTGSEVITQDHLVGVGQIGVA